MPLRPRVRTASSTALVALVLVACSSGPPDDASVEDFCDTWTADRDGSTEEMHQAAERLDEVGTPDDIDDAPRAGFEVFVDAISDIDQEQLEQLDQAIADSASLAEIYGISEDEAADVVSFFDYANGTCTDAG